MFDKLVEKNVACMTRLMWCTGKYLRIWIDLEFDSDHVRLLETIGLQY